MSRQMRTALDMAGNQINSAADPTLAQDVATKNYVDTRPGAPNEVAIGPTQPVDGSELWVDTSS